MADAHQFIAVVVIPFPSRSPGMVVYLNSSVLVAGLGRISLSVRIIVRNRRTGSSFV